MENSLEFAQTYSDIVGYIGFVGALLGWLYQLKRNQYEKHQELRGLWDNISAIKAAMGKIERAESKNKKLPHEIYQSHSVLSVLFRNLLTRVITREDNVTLETISKWRKTGKLGSDWQQKCAMTILLTDELTEKELSELDEKFSQWETIFTASPLNSDTFDSNINNQNIKKIHNESINKTKT